MTLSQDHLRFRTTLLKPFLDSITELDYAITHDADLTKQQYEAIKALYKIVPKYFAKIMKSKYKRVIKYEDLINNDDQIYDTENDDQNAISSRDSNEDVEKEDELTQKLEHELAMRLKISNDGISIQSSTKNNVSQTEVTGCRGSKLVTLPIKFLYKSLPTIKKFWNFDTTSHTISFKEDDEIYLIEAENNKNSTSTFEMGDNISDPIDTYTTNIDQLDHPRVKLTDYDMPS